MSRNGRDTSEFKKGKRLLTVLRSKTIEKNSCSTFDKTTRPSTTFKRSQYLKQPSMQSIQSLKSLGSQKGVMSHNNHYQSNNNLNNATHITHISHLTNNLAHPSILEETVSPQILDSLKESPVKKSTFSSSKLNKGANEITFRERQMIRNLKSNRTRREANLSATTLKEDLNTMNINVIKTIKTASSNSKPKESLKESKNSYNLSLRLRRLVETSPYHNIPKSVKYSFTNNKEIEKQCLPKLKGHCLTKEGNQYKQVYGGSSTVFFNENRSHSKDSILKKLLIIKVEASAAFKKSIKWKNLKWLLTHKSVYIDQIIASYKNMKWFINSRQGKISLPIFEELMSLISDKQLKRDPEFNEYVFLLFDEDRDGIIDFNEMVAGLLFFREDSYLYKINVLTDLCLVDVEKNKVSVEEFFRLVRTYIFNKKDLKKLYDIMKNTCHSKETLIDRKTFFDFIASCEEVKNIFQRSMENVVDKETFYEEEINTISKSNLKRSKMSANPDIGMCPNDYTVFEKILEVRHNVSVNI